MRDELPVGGERAGDGTKEKKVRESFPWVGRQQRIPRNKSSKRGRTSAKKKWRGANAKGYRRERKKKLRAIASAITRRGGVGLSYLYSPRAHISWGGKNQKQASKAKKRSKSKRGSGQ